MPASLSDISADWYRLEGIVIALCNPPTGTTPQMQKVLDQTARYKAIVIEKGWLSAAYTLPIPPPPIP